ncbi:MAG: class I SAM-dependent methyltransferase [Nitrospirae bacterium]|nr:class I SAM-dependent methyltransferase [Nitrospirota bacterium]
MESLAIFHAALNRRFLDFIFDEGIAGVLSGQHECDEFERIVELLENSHGYTLKDGNRRRMIAVLLDFLTECGYRRQGRYTADGVNREPAHGSLDSFEGEYNFFSRCIDYAGEYLRGGKPLYDFNGGCVDTWDEFLGNPEFEYARGVLAKKLYEGCRALDRVLVLCYGPGYDICHLQRYSEDVKITAVDYNGAFYEAARAKLLRPDAVQWIHSDKWGGFGSPLPFEDGYFDAAVFSCADPYIAGGHKRFVYEDIYRVLTRHGLMGIITRGYPDSQCGSDKLYQRAALCHDFAESVCEGWQGFYSAKQTRALLGEIGFDIKSLTLNECLWMAAKS